MWNKQSAEELIDVIIFLLQVLFLKLQHAQIMFSFIHILWTLLQVDIKCFIDIYSYTDST